VFFFMVKGIPPKIGAYPEFTQTELPSPDGAVLTIPGKCYRSRRVGLVGIHEQVERELCLNLCTTYKVVEAG
jgi:hypothetical protein